MILAAIDIGSNASRMIISEAHQYNDGSLDFVKLNLLRIPLRLGFDVFRFGMIPAEKRQMIIDTMLAYQQLNKIYKVEHCVACATSAMRDARNSIDIVQSVKAATGISIEILSGAEEATVLYDAHLQVFGNKDEVCLYIDVGGGSTELTLFNDSKLISKKSFNIGTIRLLTDLVSDELWEEMKSYCKALQKKYSKIKPIGAGGNINKIFSLSKTKEGKPLSAALIKDYYRELAACTVEQRMQLYQLREDRADVIVPALQIFNAILKSIQAEEIFVPKMSLADGLLCNLYHKVKSGKISS